MIMRSTEVTSEGTELILRHFTTWCTAVLLRGTEVAIQGTVVMPRDNGISSEETGMIREITEVATVDTYKVKGGNIKRHEG